MQAIIIGSSVLVFALLPVLILGELLQVQIVHRHGLREHLHKHEIHPGQENGAVLLPAGRKQLITLGDFIRKRYILDTNNSPKFRSAFTSPADFISISSNLDRTLTSSRAFVFGLYPENAPFIPTKVFNSKENDYRLRGYTFCPEFTFKLKDNFFQSKEFLKKKNENKKFLERVATPIGEFANLTNAFNIFDIYHLANLNESTVPDAGRLNPEDFARLKSLADWVEISKYSASNIPGTPLLATMLNYSLEISASKDARMTHRIIEYSAHYPTLLSLFSATEHYKMKAIPEFGSALIWETHRDSRTKGVFIRTFWYPGGAANKTDLTEIQLFPKMDLNSIQNGRLKGISPGPRFFCMRCGTNPSLHPICAPNVLPASIADNTTDGSGASAWGFSSKYDVCATARLRATFFGIVIGIVVILAIFTVMRCFRKRFLINSYHLRDPDLPSQHRMSSPGVGGELDEQENRFSHNGSGRNENWAPDDWSPKHDDIISPPPARTRSGPSSSE